MTLKEVGERSGIGFGSISQIEIGRRSTRLPIMHKIAIALDVKLSEIIAMAENIASTLEQA